MKYGKVWPHIFFAILVGIFVLLNNPDLTKTIGENGRKLVMEKFGDNTQKIVKLWQDLANNSIEN